MKDFLARDFLPLLDGGEEPVAPPRRASAKRIERVFSQWCGPEPEPKGL